jgi:hypothetical protein
MYTASVSTHVSIEEYIPFLNTNYRYLPHIKPAKGVEVAPHTYYLKGEAQFNLLPFLLRGNYYRLIEYWFGRTYVEDSNTGKPIPNTVDYEYYTKAILDAIELSALGDGRHVIRLEPRRLRVSRKGLSYIISATPQEFRGSGIAVLANHTDHLGVITRYRGGIGSVCL